MQPCPTHDPGPEVRTPRPKGTLCTVSQAQAGRPYWAVLAYTALQCPQIAAKCPAGAPGLQNPTVRPCGSCAAQVDAGKLHQD